MDISRRDALKFIAWGVASWVAPEPLVALATQKDPFEGVVFEPVLLPIDSYGNFIQVQLMSLSKALSIPPRILIESIESTTFKRQFP